MSNYPGTYETVSNITESGLQYFFVSEGQNDVIKAVQFSYMLEFEGRSVYNLGFGDYDADTDNVSDDLTTNNGDQYSVFHIVLSTIPKFFNINAHAMIMVRGSDSTTEFRETCKTTCGKRCKVDECKNYNRRINIYRNYVNKNYDTLIKEYQFFGGLLNSENEIVIEKYRIGKSYDSVLLTKNPNFTV